jgi:hypothetical protein
VKKELLAGIAVLLLATGAACAASHPRVVVGKPRITVMHYFNYLPPPEYDKPFTGKLTIRRLETEEEVFRTCKTSRVACAWRVADGSACHLLIVNDKVIRSNHGSWAFTLRHELGHCNGWTQEHERKRKVEIKDVGMPTLPKDIEILPSYPPVVCVTPEWKQEPCEKRNTPAVVAGPNTWIEILKVKPTVDCFATQCSSEKTP